MQRALSHIASTTSNTSTATSMDGGADLKIFLADTKEGYVKSNSPLITKGKEFVSNWNTNFPHKYGSGCGGHRYRGRICGPGGYYGNIASERKGKDEDTAAPSTKKTETRTSTCTST